MCKRAIGFTAVLWIVLLGVVGMPMPAQAAEIPSAASGQFSAPDRLCRLELSRAGWNHVDVDLLCITDAGDPTYSRTRIEAWAGRCPGSPYTAQVFGFSGPSVLAGFVALDAFDGTSLHVRVAPDPTTLYNGGGQPQTWTLIRPVNSPAPYTCGTPTQISGAGSVSANCRLNPRAPWCGR